MPTGCVSYFRFERIVSVLCNFNNSSNKNKTKNKTKQKTVRLSE